MQNRKCDLTIKLIKFQSTVTLNKNHHAFVVSMFWREQDLRQGYVGMCDVQCAA